MSAVETRFLLPAYIFAYLTVLAPGWANLAATTRSVAARSRVAALWLTCFAVYILMVLHVVDSATDQLVLV